MSEQTQKTLSNIFSFDPGTLPTAEELEARRKAEEAYRLMDVARSRRDALEAPKRLLLARSSLNLKTPWGEKLEKLKNMIGKGSILVLRGKPGTGKTQMAVELLLHGIESNLSAKFIKFSDLQQTLKGSFGKTGEEQEIIKDLIRPSVLAIDEFDWAPVKREQVTDDYWQSVLYHIIDHRYDDMKDTILTSNKSKEEFQKTTIAPIRSRMEETGGAVSTDDWTDWRAQKNTEKNQPVF